MNKYYPTKTAIIISPLLALIKSQVDNLIKLGLKVIQLSSLTSKKLVYQN